VTADPIGPDLVDAQPGGSHEPTGILE
jgi:hypothetical protein